MLPPGAREGEGDLYCPRSERGRDGCAAAGGQCEIGWYFSARVRSGSCCTSGFSSSAARPAAPGSNTRQVGGGGGAEPPSLHACRPPAGEAMGARGILREGLLCAQATEPLCRRPAYGLRFRRAGHQVEEAGSAVSSTLQPSDGAESPPRALEGKPSRGGVTPHLSREEGNGQQPS